MPKDKTVSHERIIPAAKKEFLEKGFEKASMRSIASSVGMTSAALYRHFTDKEAMFSALVEPMLSELEKQYDIIKERDYALLEQSNIESMWDSNANMELILDFIYRYFDEFKLLICCAEGTRHAQFVHDFVMMEQRETIAFMEAARERGVEVNAIRPDELHLLISAYISALFEVVVHDFNVEDARHYLKTLQDFFYPGWRKVLGF